MSAFCTPGVRALFLQWNAGLVSTGLVDAEGLARRDAGSLRRASRDEVPGYQVLQLFGADPGILAPAIEQGEELGYDAFELNLGCPSGPLLKRGCGAALLDRPSSWKPLLEALRASTDLPVGIKCRLGSSSSDHAFIDLYHVAAATGMNWCTIHPRSTEQEYAGRAEWSRLDELKAISGPAIRAGGDLNTAAEARHALADRPWLEAVLIGRAAMIKPWIFMSCITGQEPDLAGKASMLAELLRRLASELDTREGARVLPGLSSVLGLELGAGAQFALSDRRRQPEFIDLLIAGLEAGPVAALRENPFLRR